MFVRFADGTQQAGIWRQYDVLSPEAIACELQARSTHAHDTTGHIVGASKISTSAFTASMEIAWLRPVIVESGVFSHMYVS